MVKRLMAVVTVLVVAFLLASGRSLAEAPVSTATKQLAGSPQDILNGSVRLPNPAEVGTRSHSATLPITLQQGADGVWAWEGDVRVDNGEELGLMLFAPEGARWDLRLQAADGAVLELNPTLQASNVRYEAGQLGIGTMQYPGDVYVVSQAQVGTWRARISAPSATGAGPHGYLLVSSEKSAYRLYSHLASYDLHVGKEIGLVTSLVAINGARGGEQALVGAITQAEVRLMLPDKRELRLPMTDEGLTADGAARDGRFGATLRVTEPGNYVAQVIVSGITPDGQPFQRTTEHLFPVIDPALSLAGDSFSAQAADDTRLRINLAATATRGAVGSVNAFAEVWGTAADGRLIPVAWVGGIVAPETSRDGLTLPLTLDSRWIALAGARAPFELRNVRVQDVTTHLPIARLERASLTVGALPAAATSKVSAITDEMLMGPRPANLRTPSQPLAGRKLMLVHGYCSGSVWPTSQFTSPALFQDLNKNRTHDAFANLIKNYGAQFDSFGVVAHSQGGAASLHLYTYYWSGLDNALGTRLIQSVGTPYQGTALAGNLAVLGQIFGVGCGTNFDLTYDGAALWLSGIPSWARSKVYYATTSFKDVWYAYDYCHLGSDLLLGDPDDGTTEQAKGQLSGANNLGHKTGWCHTTGMRDPAQYTDSARNSNMNSNAAR